MGWISNAGSDPRFTVVRKTADEIVNNSDVLQDDDELKANVQANEVSFVTLILEALSASLTNLKIAFAVPVGATIVELLDTFHAFGAEADGTGAIAIGSMSGTAKAWRSYWLYRGGANAGTLQFQWAQNAVTAENTTVKAGSHLILTKA